MSQNEMEGHAQKAAFADPDYQTNPTATVDKWRNYYGANRPAQGTIPPALMTAPSADQRTVGQVYPTPRGLMTWTGQGWVPAQQ
jgi:hypothetical protein